MYGVYFINRGDEDWTKLVDAPTEDKAMKIMSGFSRIATERFNSPPDCVAISKGRDEDHVPRRELKAASCE